ncbi:rhomboid family intramembrane serine protease [Chitinophagaceae bacterium LWZ2-11]
MSITLIIVIITCAISIPAFSNQKMIDDLIFYPPAVSKRNQYYRFVSHALIHADIPHLAFNMIALYSFGGLIEKVFSLDCIFGSRGKVIYILLYLFGAIAAILPTYFKNRDNYAYRSLGASGAVSAIVFAGLVIYPQLPVQIMFIPIDIPGFVFGPAFLIISAVLDKRQGGRVNHSAHFWGAAFGFLFILLLCYKTSNLNVIENFKNQLNSYSWKRASLAPLDCDYK